MKSAASSLSKKRAIATVLLVIMTCVGLFWPVVLGVTKSSGSSTTQVDPVTVTNYQGQFDVAADGELTAKETLTATFPSGRHGIFRFFDVTTQADPHVRLEPTVTGITMDGSAVPVSYSWENDRYYVAKIGDPNVFVSPGSHTYVISYTVPGAIFPASTGDSSYLSSEGTNTEPAQSVFYWNVVANGWRMPIKKANVTVNLPSPSGQVQCTSGASGTANSQGPCVITGAGSKTITLAGANLPPTSGMTVRAAMATPAPAQVRVPWTLAYDPVFGRSLTMVIIVGLLTVIGAVVGLIWGRSTREPEPGFPVMYAPPKDLGPVQTVYMATEDIGEHALVSSIMRAADQDLVKLYQNGSAWTVQGITTPEFWAATDPVTQQVGTSLGVQTYAATITSDGSVLAGTKIKSAVGRIKPTTSSWAESSGFTVKAPIESIGKLLWFVSIILAGVGFIGWLGPTMYGLPFAGFAIGGVVLIGTGVGTRRTETGRRLWSESAGFRRLLSTPSSEQRFDFAADKNLFISYLPYAVAFGVADKWAEKYRVEMGEEPPIPLWYPYGYIGGASMFSGGGGFDSFESSLSSSIGAYEASQSSSSSGGGGGGFGGGGGGGGGGSW